ncbi:MAG: hypothetical protein LBR73_01895 [Oscillospiraceae bacterium]|jgi:phosphoribosyl 1,2-cyclic phosphate phosphodiesterase|nr:hypothetical protein [Oscillospiraceae bacterium]
MKIKYFGTAAAEGIPALFCTCPVCRKARQLGGKNIQSRSQALIDDTLLVDLPPDTFYHTLNGLDLPSVNQVLLTHTHGDHFNTLDLWCRSKGIAHYGAFDQPLPEPLHVYASERAMEEIRKEREYCGCFEKPDVFAMHPLQRYVPTDTLTHRITAMTADHSQNAGAVIYIIEDKSGTAMLYGNDTGWFPEETWDYLAQTKPYFAYVSLDTTGVTQNYRSGHMGFSAGIEVREKLIGLGCADEKTVFCHVHYSHNGRMVYDEIAVAAADHGFLAAYDGFEVQF